jgi:hypothetical protein
VCAALRVHLSTVVSRRRPFARRRFRIRRPPGVLIRFRNPWVRLRRMRLG